MKFRPCIDLHQGKVKQIVGESLGEPGQAVTENFVSEHSPSYYAEKFRQDGLLGGHVIMLGPGNEAAGLEALAAYPGGLHIGGGITDENAAHYLEHGASHVIVTSFIFRDGQLDERRLDRLISEVGRERLVIDLSCKQSGDSWFVATNQWKTLSSFEVTQTHLRELESCCAEFLIHAVDVEGKRAGIHEGLVSHLAASVAIPTTYAGGARSMEDLELFRRLAGERLDITIGSALDIFGGALAYDEVVAYCR